MYRYNMVYPDVVMLFVNTKKWSIDTCYNMDEHFKHYAKDQTQVSPMAGRFFTIWATTEAQEYWSG